MPRLLHHAPPGAAVRTLRRTLAVVAVGTALAAGASRAAAQVIYAPVGGVIDVGTPGFGALSDTYNQSGLSAGYVSGVTSFAGYIGTNPLHTQFTAGTEWFSSGGTATVTYDLGAALNVTRLALWNEESNGIGLLNVYGSADGTSFAALALGLTPIDNPAGADYPAQLFTLAAGSARYVRLEMSRCPGLLLPRCSIGEVAFEVGATTTTAPEPGTWALLGTGLVGVAGAGARRKRASG